MAEVLYSKGSIKSEMFDDSESNNKADFFDGKIEELPGDNDMLFGFESSDFFSGNDPSNNLFLMDPNDLLGVREEIVGTETSKSSEDIPVPVVSPNVDNSSLYRREVRRKRVRQKRALKTEDRGEDRDSSDLEDFSGSPLSVPPQHTPDLSTPQSKRVGCQVHSLVPVNPAVNPRIAKFGQDIPSSSNFNVISNSVVTTRRIYAFKRKPEFGRRLLPRGKII